MLVPAQNVRGGSLVPVLDKGTQQVIMICINQGVTALAHSLAVRKLGAGANSEDGFGDDLALINNLVQVTSKCVHLVLPQVAQHGQRAGNIAVEGGIAHRQLGFVGVAAEGAAEGGRGSCNEACTTVPCLDVLLHKSAELKVKGFVILQMGHGRGAELRHRVLIAFSNGKHGVIGAQSLGQIIC